MKLNKTCVWYHGLMGEPNLAIKTALMKLGYYVVSEHIDFYKEWVYDKGKSLMERQIKKLHKIDLVIGISFGGYVAYLLSKATGSDLLLINPALNRDRSKTGIFHFDTPKCVKKCNIEIFFGELDSVVPMAYTKEFLEETEEEYKAWIVKNMEHRIDGNILLAILTNSELIKNGFNKKICTEKY